MAQANNLGRLPSVWQNKHMMLDKIDNS